ncbi:MAG: hypothetical protein OEZ36_06970, partial [Spirochaetota bacterium]|nr:hypothetical protein [Spirochaetota bacterium]
YQDVLGIKKVTGNGYFTAMVGMFFAEYQFKKDENISFKDVVSYVTNRGKQYVEYLALWGKEDKLQKKFASLRLNQQPKILPIKRKVEFQDVNHSFFLIQKPIEPLGLMPGAVGGVFFPMGTFGEYYDSPSIYANVFVSYKLDFIVENLYLTANVGLLSMAKTPVEFSRDVNLTLVVPAGGVKYMPVKAGFFSLGTSLEFGGAFTFATVGSLGPIKEESKTLKSLYIGAEVGFTFEVYEGLSIVLPSRFMFVNYTDEPLIGFSTTLGASYYF